MSEPAVLRRASKATDGSENDGGSARPAVSRATRAVPPSPSLQV